MQTGGIALDAAAMDLVRTADARSTAAAKECAALRSSLASATEELTVARHAQSNREEEIMRLQALLEGTRDVERLSLEYRNEANEKTIVSLNKQLDHLTMTLDKMHLEVCEARPEARYRQCRLFCARCNDPPLAWRVTSGSLTPQRLGLSGNASVQVNEKSQLQVALKESLREQETLLTQARAATTDYDELKAELERLQSVLATVQSQAKADMVVAEEKLTTAVDGAEQLRAALESAHAKAAAGEVELDARLRAAAAAAATSMGEAEAAKEERADAAAESLAARERVAAAEAALAAAAETEAVLRAELDALRVTEATVREKCSQLEEDLQVPTHTSPTTEVVGNLSSRVGFLPVVKRKRKGE